MQSMKTPSTRAEFERNFHLLIRSIEDGRFHVPRDMILDHLMRVRYLPNGRIDLLSIDESARLQANMSGQFDDEAMRRMFTEMKPPEGAAKAGEDEKPEPTSN